MPTRTEIAKEAFEAAGNDAVEAASILYNRLDSDPQLYAQFAEPLLREWCADVIGAECVRHPRATVWNATVNAASNERAKVFAQSLLDFPLPGGKPLSQATRSDLDAAVDFYTKQANNMAWKARWLGRIAQEMGRKRTVGAAFDNAALERMQRETEITERVSSAMETKSVMPAL